MTDLEPCPRCDRHVRVTETACPFCAVALDFADREPRALPRARLGRAATFAFGVIATTQSACGDNKTGHPAPVDAAAPADSSIDAGNVPIYAAAPTPDGGNTGRG